MGFYETTAIQQWKKSELKNNNYIVYEGKMMQIETGIVYQLQNSSVAVIEPHDQGDFYTYIHECMHTYIEFIYF